jgi:type IX secretion system PorP/SprF family membrane protein
MLPLKDNIKNTMRIKFSHLPILLIFTALNIQAQQIFKLNPFVQPDFVFNPAAAGVNENLSIGLSHKKMWDGIDGGPQTTVLFADNYYSKLNTGVGFFLYNDVTGPTQRTGGEIGVSYSVPFSNNKKLMFGLSGQAMQEKINFEEVQKYIPGDPLLSGNNSVFSGDAAAGIYFASKKLKVGFSAKQLIQSKLNFIKSDNNIYSRLYRHYYFMGSYNFIADDENIITPNILIKFVSNAPADIEVGAKIEHRDFISCGFGYHYKQNYTAFVGLKINHALSFQYVYEQYKTPLSTFDGGGGSNELVLKYTFKNK